jgi:hypothetical protein
MGNRYRLKAIVLWLLPMLAACDAAAQTSGGSRLLTLAEMDQITVGSANAAIDISALALAPAAQATTSSGTLAVSGVNSSFGNALGRGTAISSQSADVNGSSHLFVSSANGGASIDATGTATATGAGNGQAQMSLQFFGVTMSRVDLVFGNATSGACCSSNLGAHVAASGAAGGPYSTELAGFSGFDSAGQTQRRVDFAVASSAQPIVDPGQMAGPLSARGSPQYQ